MPLGLPIVCPSENDICTQRPIFFTAMLRKKDSDRQNFPVIPSSVPRRQRGYGVEITTDPHGMESRILSKAIGGDKGQRVSE